MALDKIFRQRCALIGLLLGFCFLGLGGRLVHIQLLQSPLFEQKAKNQHKINIVLEPRRGEITDTKGRVLAMSVPTKTVFAIPSRISNPEATIEKLSTVLPISETVSERIKSGKSFVYVQRKLEAGLAEKIEALDLDGIYLQDDSRRHYPNAELLSHVLGFVGTDGNGLEGLELYLDKYLRGGSGLRVTERDATGREVLAHRNQDVLPRDGYNVVLTIDEVIQHIAETELAAACQKYRPESASILVLDPKNGDILAMANLPTFDPNNAGSAPASHRRNRAITDFYEPGSTFKVVAAAAALNENQAKLSDVYYCENGNFYTAGRVLHDHNPYGNLTFAQVVEKSSNIGIAKVAMKLGESTLFDYIKRFGFGALTHIPLPGEVEGISWPPSRWSKVAITRIPMGQGIAVTPLQMTMAYAAVANDGVLMKPRIIKSIISDEGETIVDVPSAVVRRVLQPETVKKLTAVLQGVVGNRGTAARARIQGYNVAGKTGTAQKVDPKGGYSDTNFYASFVGFAPAEDPKLVVMVAMNEPKLSHYGGTVAAPVFSQVAKRTLKYLGVSPEEKTLLAELRKRQK